jgi:hypothetical protein
MKEKNAYLKGTCILWGIVLVLLFGLLIFSCRTLRAETPSGADSLDKIWTVSKFAAYGVSTGDAITTSQAIGRGYVEWNAMDNLIIDRTEPAYARRILLLNGKAFLFNEAFSLAWRHCGTSKFCKAVVIGGRAVFTIQGIHSVFHNRAMK